MSVVIGIAFKRTGKIYFFSPGPFEFHYNQSVIVETTRGLELGRVKLLPREVSDETISLPLKPVVSIATSIDEEKHAQQRQKAKEAKITVLERISANNLPMRLLDGEYTFDEKKLIFYFTADGRVDFRQLVKELAGVFKIRIELQQVGPRDETKFIGSLASCGRETCCSLFLREMPPIATKMIKTQNLPLNPSKNAGMCSKLKCCLRYEYDIYKELKINLPIIGSEVSFIDGSTGIVVAQNILKQLLTVQKTSENIKIEVPASELSIIKEGTTVAQEENPLILDENEIVLTKSE